MFPINRGSVSLCMYVTTYRSNGRIEFNVMLAIDEVYVHLQRRGLTLAWEDWSFLWIFHLIFEPSKALYVNNVSVSCLTSRL